MPLGTTVMAVAGTFMQRTTSLPVVSLTAMTRCTRRANMGTITRPKNPRPRSYLSRRMNGAQSWMVATCGTTQRHRMRR